MLNKEPFAGPEAPARGGRCAQKASALFSPYLLFTRSPAGPGRGGGDPRSAPGLASEPRGHRARRELLPAAPTWRGSQSLTWPRSVASASRPRPRPPVGWKGPGVGRALAPGARQEGRCGRRDSGARTRTQTSVGAGRPGAHREVGAPAGARGSAAGRPAAPGDQDGCSRRAAASGPRRPPPGPPGPGRGALVPRRPARALRGASHAQRGLGPRDPGGPRGVAPRRRSARPEGAGPRRPPPRPRRDPRAPAPAPAPTAPLVPGLGAGGGAGGRRRARMERGRGDEAAAVSLAPSRPAPTLFNRGRPRADTPHGLTAWLRRPGQ